jgi:hypothetical protein
MDFVAITDRIKKVNPKSASSNPFITIAFSNVKNTKVQKVNSMLIEASANNKFNLYL